MNVKHMIAGNGSVLILWRMPGHRDAVGRHIQNGEILGLAWHCKEGMSKGINKGMSIKSQKLNLFMFLEAMFRCILFGLEPPTKLSRQGSRIYLGRVWNIRYLLNLLE